MSAGPIKSARDAWLPLHVDAMPRVGDVVRPVDHPAGFPLWRVDEIPKHAAPNDIARLTPVDPACPVKRIARFAKTLRPEEES